MVSPQPIINHKYFQLRKNTYPKGIKSLFYLSWEDALWDLMNKKDIKKGSYILVPDFYCDDVEKNIKLHRYKVGYYKINKDLTVNKKSFQSCIKLLKPQVVVIFHAVGIKNNLLENTKWLSKITNDSILIEDSVHRTIDPKEIKIFKKNHFIIDSLRKVVPIQGSRIFGNSEDLDFDLPSIFQSMPYAMGVNILWLLMVVSWTLSLKRLAEKLMLFGYDLIGNSGLSARGSILGSFLSERLNVSKIQKYKLNQVRFYEKKLRGVLPHKLNISEEDKKHLRGYPVVLSKENSARVMKILRNNGLLVRFELDGSEWSKYRKIIFLPLGPYLNINNLTDVCSLVIESMK